MSEITAIGVNLAGAYQVLQSQITNVSDEFFGEKIICLKRHQKAIFPFDAHSLLFLVVVINRLLPIATRSNRPKVALTTQYRSVSFFSSKADALSVLLPPSHGAVD
ncbi:hypothetical protein [Pseudomonas sp. NPDC096950]|uniref:hypothetical protein n=1 Tax=Pseudomonas sp. NPDC096950 TaxID=3364485 RepID=UPI00383B0DBD